MPVRGVHLLNRRFYETDGGTGPQMLPEVRRDSDGHFYPHVKRELTGHQRMRLAFGLIKNVDKLGDGKVPSEAIRKFIRPLGCPGDHAGHIIPKCLNGGTHRDNFFPQHARVNQGLGSLEKKRKRDMREGNYDLQFLFVFTYPDDQEASDEEAYDEDYNEEEEQKKYPSRPISILQSIVYFRDGKAMAEATYMVLNPIANRYTILVEDTIPDSMTFLEFFSAPIVNNNEGVTMNQQYLIEQLKLIQQKAQVVGSFCTLLPDRGFFTRCVELAVLSGITILSLKLASKAPPRSNIKVAAPSPVPPNLAATPRAVAPKPVAPLPDGGFFTRCVELAAFSGISILSLKLASKAPKPPRSNIKVAAPSPVWNPPPNMRAVYKMVSNPAFVPPVPIMS